MLRSRLFNRFRDSRRDVVIQVRRFRIPEQNNTSSPLGRSGFAARARRRFVLARIVRHPAKRLVSRED
jgi:hypothetical protein